MVKQTENNKKPAGRLYSLILAGIFTAVTAICSWINIPLPFTAVPINLALLGVHLSGSLLGPRYGFYSQLIYILLGAIGVPVFAGFSGGFGIIAGPTGGFIVGYAICALIVGALTKKSAAVSRLALSMILGVIVCYGFGLIWFLILTGTSLWAGLIACVFPFLPGDGIKSFLAVLLTRRLKPVIRI